MKEGGLKRDAWLNGVKRANTIKDLAGIRALLIYVSCQLFLAMCIRLGLSRTDDEKKIASQQRRSTVQLQSPSPLVNYHLSISPQTICNLCKYIWKKEKKK